jgi:hypothetical protein
MRIDPNDALEHIMAAAEQDPSVVREVARRLGIPVMGKLFQNAMDPETSTSMRLAIGKELWLIGEMYPRKDAPAAVGGHDKFSITINIPQHTGVQPIVINATAEPEEIEGEMPDVFAIEFGGNHDLAGVAL